MTNGTRRGWGVSVTPRPLFTPWKVPVPIAQEAGWAPRPVWTGAENLAPTGIRSPDRPSRSQSLWQPFIVRLFSDFTEETSVRGTVFRLCSGGVCCLHLHGVISHKAVRYRQPKNRIPTPAQHIHVFETRYGDNQTTLNLWRVTELFRNLNL